MSKNVVTEKNDKNNLTTNYKFKNDANNLDKILYKRDNKTVTIKNEEQLTKRLILRLNKELLFSTLAKNKRIYLNQAIRKEQSKEGDNKIINENKSKYKFKVKNNKLKFEPLNILTQYNQYISYQNNNDKKYIVKDSLNNNLNNSTFSNINVYKKNTVIDNQKSIINNYYSKDNKEDCYQKSNYSKRNSVSDNDSFSLDAFINKKLKKKNIKKCFENAQLDNLIINNNICYNKTQYEFFEYKNISNNIFKSYRKFNTASYKNSINSSKSFKGKKYCLTEREKFKKEIYSELKGKVKNVLFRNNSTKKYNILDKYVNL